MVTTALTVLAVMQGASPQPPAGEGGGLGSLFLVLAVVLLFFALRAQFDPFTNCSGKAHSGKVQGSRKKKYSHRCGRCGGSAEVLRWGAWLQMKLGMPVPRAHSASKKHPLRMPDD